MLEGNSVSLDEDQGFIYMYHRRKIYIYIYILRFRCRRAEKICDEKLTGFYFFYVCTVLSLLTISYVIR